MRVSVDTRQPPGTNDSSLLARAREGDERAFGRLVARHRNGLEVFCRLMLGCPDRAHDAVVETLVRGWRELAYADPAASPRIWLYRVATGVCLEDSPRSDEFHPPRPFEQPKADDR